MWVDPIITDWRIVEIVDTWRGRSLWLLLEIYIFCKSWLSLLIEGVLRRSGLFFGLCYQWLSSDFISNICHFIIWHFYFLPITFLPFGIFADSIFTIWHFYHRHFYHWHFYLLALLPSDIFTTGIITVWHVYHWHLNHSNLLPFTINLIGYWPIRQMSYYTPPSKKKVVDITKSGPMQSQRPPEKMYHT